MLLDKNGVPYHTGELVWSGEGAVQLADFAPSRVFETPDSIYLRQEEGKTGASLHYGNDLSHHAQQLLALKYLRDNAGFDNVVWCNTAFANGKAVMVLQLDTGLWCETKEVM